MNALLDLLRKIPGAAKAVALLVLVLAVLYLVYIRYGLVATLVLAGGILLIWLAIIVYRAMIRQTERQQGLAFGKALDAAQQGPTREELRSAVDDLDRKWREAMGNLRTSGIDIYKLPWYMLIGEPQSGKSTTLKYSGLRFPIGTESISGAGGTRNCDWWFTEQGVILDTAGRFTFQEATATDAAEWNHFLKLLSRHRPFCPINGIILVIPVDALLDIGRAALEEKARNISDKLTHIQRQLAIQFPIYLMLTKCDQIYGFVQFFNKLNPDQQREMFGWSNPEEASGFNMETFEESFDNLVARIDRLRLDYLRQAGFVSDLEKAYVFPEEFRSLREPLKHYLETIFKPSLFKDPLLFRGYYFTSGMQEGLPIIKACKEMIADNRILEKLENVFKTNRAFFVRDFYSEKVFPEEGLVRRASQHERKDRLKRRLVYGFNLGMLLLGLLFTFLMYRSLKSRMEVPKAAIDRATATLKDTRGTFFDSAHDRQEIYRTLAELKAGVATTRTSGGFNFFRARSNALTRSMEDTFGYLFLDRFLLGLFQSVDRQLRDFRLQVPGDQRSSERELALLCAALTELHSWQAHLADQGGRFEPSIAPFLALGLEPAWNDELLAYRKELTLADDLERWFQDVYRNSSERVRDFLIRSLVDRSMGANHMYAGLERRVEAFYRDQPEIGRFREKQSILTRLDEGYRDLQSAEVSWQRYDEKLAAFSRFFDPETRALVQAENDAYLPFDVVRNRVIDALGPGYAHLKTHTAAAADGLAAGAARALSGRGPKLDQAVDFVRLLDGMDAAGLPDPRRESGVATTGSLAYPAEALSFWDHILQSYMEKFRSDTTPYAGVVDPSRRLNANLDNLFDKGMERMRLLKTQFQDESQVHVATIPNERDGRRMEQALNEFYDLMVAREREAIDQNLLRTITGEDIAAPRPPEKWGAYLDEFNRLSARGQDFSRFTEGPRRVNDMLKDYYARQIREIYFAGETPLARIDTYIRDVHANLADFALVLQEMEAIPDSRLVGDASYRRGTFKEAGLLRRLGTMREVPPLMEPHLTSLRAWSDAAVAGFRQKAGGVDPCPQCKVEFRQIVLALDKAQGFPVRFKGNTRETESGLGLLEVTAEVADPAAVLDLLDKIDVYKNPTDLQRAFLQDLGKTEFMRQAVAWSAGVRKLLAGSMDVFYQIRHVEEHGSDDLPSLTSRFAFCDMDGGYQSRRIQLNTPRFTKIEKNGVAESDITTLRFHNQSQTDKTESLVSIKGGLFGLLAYCLDQSSVYQQDDQTIKRIALSLNNSPRKVQGHLILKTSEPLPPPPDWSQISGR